MSIDFGLVLGGIIPIEQVAERALSQPGERSWEFGANFSGEPLISANLYEQLGFLVTIRNGKHRFLELTSDDGELEWSPAEYTSVSFNMNKFADFTWSFPNMVAVVRRVLETGTEDAVFHFNGDLLILARFDGVLVKHNREKWWSYYPDAERLFPG